MSRFINLEFDGQSAERTHGQEPVRDEMACLNAARGLFEQGDFEQALRLYARALEFNPNSLVAWVGQVRMLIELGDYKEAKVWSDKALERFPQAAELLAGKAVALARLGDLSAALAFSDAAMAERGEGPYLWLARGDVLLARGEKRAEYCFTKALAVAPREWIWPWLASRIHYFYRQFALALRHISQALTIDAAQAPVWLQMGRCQLALGLASAAQTSFQQALQLHPQCTEASVALTESQTIGFWQRLEGQLRRWFQR